MDSDPDLDPDLLGTDPRIRIHNSVRYTSIDFGNRVQLLTKFKIQLFEKKRSIFFTKCFESSTLTFISASVLEIASRRGVRRFILSTRFPSESNTACKITPEFVMMLKCIFADPGCLSPITDMDFSVLELDFPSRILDLDFSMPDPQH
jgi:hypothetical protein